MAVKPGTTGTISDFPVAYLEALDEVLMGATYAQRYAVQGAEFVRNRQVSVPTITFNGTEVHDYDQFKTNDQFKIERKLYELKNDKQATFYVDAADSIDEAAAQVTKIMSEWIRQIFAPEVDKDFFAKAATAAGTTADSVTISTDNVKAEIRKMRSAFVAKGLQGGDLYVTSDVLGALEDAINREYSNETSIVDSVGNYTGFNLFAVSPELLGENVNFLGISGGTNTLRNITKRAVSYLFAPGNHTEGDGWLAQNRWIYDTIVREQRKPGLYLCKSAAE